MIPFSFKCDHIGAEIMFMNFGGAEINIEMPQFPWPWSKVEIKLSFKIILQETTLNSVNEKDFSDSERDHIGSYNRGIGMYPM